MINSRVVVDDALQHNLGACHQSVIGRGDDHRIVVKQTFDQAGARHTRKDRDSILSAVGNVVTNDSTGKVAVHHTESNAVTSGRNELVVRDDAGHIAESFRIKEQAVPWCGRDTVPRNRQICRGRISEVQVDPVCCTRHSWTNRKLRRGELVGVTNHLPGNKPISRQCRLNIRANQVVSEDGCRDSPGEIDVNHKRQ